MEFMNSEVTDEEFTANVKKAIMAQQRWDIANQQLYWNNAPGAKIISGSFKEEWEQIEKA